MKDCLFCQIANHDKEKLVWENQAAAAFNDIHPSAPIHILVVPKKHIKMLQDLDDPALGGELLMAVQAVAAQAGLADGYRVVINVGRPGGQVVDHLHIHVLGGKNFSHQDAAK
jgi:histidine triad (HIT) family protein